MTTKDLILFLLGLLVFYHLFLKKENFSLPSGIISDPNSLDPNKRYIIYNRRASNLQQNSAKFVGFYCGTTHTNSSLTAVYL
jgi:hypothetical protein